MSEQVGPGSRAKRAPVTPVRPLTALRPARPDNAALVAKACCPRVVWSRVRGVSDILYQRAIAVAGSRTGILPVFSNRGWKPVPLRPARDRGLRERSPPLEHSLSALLPVRNAEGTLAETISEWLEVLPELTSRFEMVVVDDCSSDATIEIADELGGAYPQLVVVRHSQPRGRSAAIATGLRRARGEMIFLADEDCDLSLGEVRKLWIGLEEHELVLGRPAAARQRKWLLHKTPVPGGSRGFQIGYRRAFHVARSGHDGPGNAVGPSSPQRVPVA